MTREEVEAFVHVDPELGEMTGWQALRRRAWLLAMTSDPKDAIRYMQWLDARAHGAPKQALELSGEVAASAVSEEDWRKVPIERRRELVAAALELEALGVSDTEH